MYISMNGWFDFFPAKFDPSLKTSLYFFLCKKKEKTLLFIFKLLVFGSLTILEKILLPPWVQSFLFFLLLKSTFRICEHCFCSMCLLDRVPFLGITPYGCVNLIKIAQPITCKLNCIHKKALSPRWNINNHVFTSPSLSCCFNRKMVLVQLKSIKLVELTFLW